MSDNALHDWNGDWCSLLTHINTPQFKNNLDHLSQGDIVMHYIGCNNEFTLSVDDHIHYKLQYCRKCAISTVLFQY